MSPGKSRITRWRETEDARFDQYLIDSFYTGGDTDAWADQPVRVIVPVELRKAPPVVNDPNLCGRGAGIGLRQVQPLHGDPGVEIHVVKIVEIVKRDEFRDAAVHHGRNSTFTAVKQAGKRSSDTFRRQLHLAVNALEAQVPLIRAKRPFLGVDWNGDGCV